MFDYKQPQKSVVLIGTSAWALGALLATLGGAAALLGGNKKEDKKEEVKIDPSERAKTNWTYVESQDINLLKNSFLYMQDMNKKNFFSLMFDSGFYRITDTAFGCFARNILHDSVMYSVDFLSGNDRFYVGLVRTENKNLKWEDGLIFDCILSRLFNNFSRKKDFEKFLMETTGQTLKLYKNFIFKFSNDKLYISITFDSLATKLKYDSSRYIEFDGKNLKFSKENKSNLILDQRGRIFDVDKQGYWKLDESKKLTIDSDFTGDRVLRLKNFTNFKTVCCTGDESSFLNFKSLTFTDTFSLQCAGLNTVTRGNRDNILSNLGMKMEKNLYTVTYPLFHIITENISNSSYSSYLYKYLPQYSIIINQELLKSRAGNSDPSSEPNNNLEQYGHSTKGYFTFSSFGEKIVRKDITDTIHVIFTKTCACLILNKSTFQEIKKNIDNITNQFYEHVSKDKYGFIIIYKSSAPIQVLYKILQIYSNTNKYNRHPNFFPLDISTDAICVTFRLKFNKNFTGYFPVFHKNGTSYIVSYDSIFTPHYSLIYLEDFGSETHKTDKSFKEMTGIEIENYIQNYKL